MGGSRSDVDKEPFITRVDNAGNIVRTRFSGEAGGEIRGSIQQTNQGLSYLVAGANITVASSSDGQVTITGAASGVPTTRLVSTTIPLQGGGDLSTDRTLTIRSASAVDAGGISVAEWVRLNDLGNNYVTSSRTITTTAPIDGGGNLTANRTLTLRSASATDAGGMTPGDFTKLSSIPANADGTFNALGAATGTISFNTQKLGPVGSPAASVDAATRGWVESITGSIAGSTGASLEFYGQSSQTNSTAQYLRDGAAYVEQVYTATFTPANSTSYTITIGGQAITITSGPTATAATIMRQFTNAINANATTRALVACGYHGGSATLYLIDRDPRTATTITESDGNITLTQSQAQASYTRMGDTSVAVHAAYADDAAGGNTFPGPTTAAVKPGLNYRLASSVAANWNGGNVVINALDADGQVITITWTEANIQAAGTGLIAPTTVTGAGADQYVVTISSITKSAVGTGTSATVTLSIGTVAPTNANFWWDIRDAFNKWWSGWAGFPVDQLPVARYFVAGLVAYDGSGAIYLASPSGIGTGWAQSATYDGFTTIPLNNATTDFIQFSTTTNIYGMIRVLKGGGATDQAIRFKTGGIYQLPY